MWNVENIHHYPQHSPTISTLRVDDLPIAPQNLSHSLVPQAKEGQGRPTTLQMAGQTQEMEDNVKPLDFVT